MKYKLNKADLFKIGKGLLIAMAGAGLTYLVDAVPNIDFGEYAPIAVAVFSVLVNMVRKFLVASEE